MKITLTKLLLFANLIAFSQTNVTDKFLFKFHPNDEVPLPYRFFIPENIDAEKDYPLILTLHGRGESGTDNEIQINLNHIATVWADSLFQLNHPSFIVSPQCPWDNYWSDDAAINSVFEIIDSITMAYNIDKSRIYITGLSMGGYGTWAALTQRPDMFAAAMPVCGSWDPNAIPLFTHVPVWNHHGGSDNVVPVQDSRTIMKKYEELELPVVTPNCYNFVCNETNNETKQRFINDNVDYLYSEYYNVGHDSWNYAYTDSLALEWVFSKTKRIKGLIQIENKGTYNLLPKEYKVELSSTLDSGYHELLFSNDLGYTWQQVVSDSFAIDSLIINTELLPESAFGLFKVQQVSNTLVTATDYSTIKRIDNEENGSPLLRYALSNKLVIVNDDELSVNFLAGDPELDALTLSVFFKPEPDSAYQFVSNYSLETLPTYQEVSIVMKDLPYGIKSRLKFELTDGEHVISDSTRTFKNNHNKPVNIDYNEAHVLSVYPNPSNGTFYIEFNENNNSLLEIYSVAGKLVHKESLNTNKKQIDLSYLNKGIYLIELKNDMGITNKRIVIN